MALRVMMKYRMMSAYCVVRYIRWGFQTYLNMEHTIQPISSIGVNGEVPANPQALNIGLNVSVH